MEYPYTLEPQEDGGLVVQFVDLEEAFTEGATPEECAFNAAEVLTGVLEQRLADGVEIPRPSEGSGLPVASPQPGRAAYGAISRFTMRSNRSPAR